MPTCLRATGGGLPARADAAVGWVRVPAQSATQTRPGACGARQQLQVRARRVLHGEGGSRERLICIRGGQANVDCAWRDEQQLQRAGQQLQQKREAYDQVCPTWCACPCGDACRPDTEESRVQALYAYFDRVKGSGEALAHSCAAALPAESALRPLPLHQSRATLSLVHMLGARGRRPASTGTHPTLLHRGRSFDRLLTIHHDTCTGRDGIYAPFILTIIGTSRAIIVLASPRLISWMTPPCAGSTGEGQ